MESTKFAPHNAKRLKTFKYISLATCAFVALILIANNKNALAKTMPPILVWNPGCYGDAMLRMLEGFVAGYPSLSDKVKCSHSCDYTDDRRIETNASAIIFFLHEKCPIDGWPQHRRADQTYVMFTAESPVNTLPYYNRSIMTDTWFNATVTYRTDSTVAMPYDRLVRITPDTPEEDVWTDLEVLNKVRNKSALAFQVVSNCNASSGRELLVKKLSEFMPIDVSGGCTQRACDQNCYWQKMESHFFYLAFENSVCPQYVTEKFWRSLRALTVPVVLQRAVLAGVEVPQNAFIAADDFGSVKELADHLKALQNDTKRYLQHFEWTKRYRKSHFAILNSPLCTLCQFAHRQFEQDLTNTVNLDKHWTTKDCKTNFVQNFLIKN
uniref:Fucosyltransferase n=1 Tax=Globodera rostochiensis TaxID=31243 RepID=A0A914ICB3_GLORO